MEFQEILYTKEEGIATITLNRPRIMNSVGGRMAGEWLAAIAEAKKDDEVKVLVVTGTGRAFCAGANPRDLAKRRETSESPATFGEKLVAEKKRMSQMAENRIPRALADFEKPYIGSINGPAIGGGMDLASMCDLRIASDRARFGMGFIRMGVTPSDGGCYYLARIVGLPKALELIWTGRVFDAGEALRIGYVNKVVPHEELPAATRELVLQLAKGPAVAIQMAKRLTYRCLSLDLHAALEAHETATLLIQNTEDAKEGPRAWVEKREPLFKGR